MNVIYLIKIFTEIGHRCVNWKKKNRNNNFKSIFGFRIKFQVNSRIDFISLEAWIHIHRVVNSIVMYHNQNENLYIFSFDVIILFPCCFCKMILSTAFLFSGRNFHILFSIAVYYIWTLPLPLKSEALFTLK